MKYWMVLLELIIGEYEKTSRSLEIAATSQEAGELALIGECHGDPDWNEDDGSRTMVWDCGEMVYRVYNTIELSKEEYEFMTSIWWNRYAAR